MAVTLCWQQCNNSVSCNSDFVVQISEQEFIHIEILIWSPDCKWSLNKYNMEGNQYQCCYIATCEGYRAFYKVAYDKQNKQLYMQSRNTLHVFDTLKFQCKHYPTQLHAGEYLVFANKCLYDIDHDEQYAIYDVKQFLTLCAQSVHPVGSGGALEGGVAIYIPSKSCIVLFGGYYAEEFGMQCDGYFPHLSNEIWCLSLLSKKWTRMVQDIGMHRYNLQAVLSSNERYIILLGGYLYDQQTDTRFESDDICVIDIKDNDKWKIAKCKFQCPATGICSATRTGGVGTKSNILVHGYIKHCWQHEDMDGLSLPTKYIINMIDRWYSAEFIHWIRSDVGHVAFVLRDLLRSVFDRNVVASTGV